MPEQWLLSLTIATIGLAAAFLAVGVTIVMVFQKPKKWHYRLFFGLAGLMIVFFLMGACAFSVHPNEENSAGHAIQWPGGDLPYWLAGMGTLALAAITFHIEIVRPRRNKPEFHIDFRNEEPYCRAVPEVVDATVDPISTTPSYWIRLKVSNVGKSVAKKCVGKLVRVMTADGSELVNYDPVALHWVGTEFGRPMLHVDLNHTEYEYLDVLHTRQDRPSQALICRDTSLRGVPDSLPPGEFILQITIYGENVEPESKKFRLIWGAGHYMDIRLDSL